MPVERLFSEEYWDNALAIGDALRERAPVHQAVLPNGVRAWVITRYDDARAALVDPRLRKDAPKLNAIQRRQLEAAGVSTDLSHLFDPHMLFRDGPEHARLRAPVAAEFTARRVEGLRPRIRELAAGLADALPTDRAVDLVDAFSFPLPLTVICELLGVPELERRPLREWTTGLMQDHPDQTGPASRAMAAFLESLIEDKRHTPGDDLISSLVSPSGTADRLQPEEILSTVFLMVVAGHETTANLITNSVRWLLDDARRWSSLAQNLDAIPAAINEVLRFDSPVRMATYRFTAEPVTIGETVIPQDEIVFVSLQTANRDHCRFAEAGTFDPGRDARGHLSFGRGPHFCLGRGLALAEAEVALTELITRFPHARLAVPAGELRRQHSAIMNSYRALPVRLAS
ncbi:cytochrome P450 [Nocardia sp. NRRL S-836]|uniref:cytochrome P450 family protein n=1 Tax=Nocardia sp. NRRL S-836 TaxID=1519492 RepID=UPI0006AEB78E|nr:cytochrome P450 [Nocardia sp. NRRL S-836]